MVNIFYNNIDAFSGVAPTPLISQKNTSIKYGETWGQSTRLSLYGVITGICVLDVNEFLITEDGNPRITENEYLRILESEATPSSSFFDALILGQDQIISNFSKDFQSLQVYENNQLIINKPYAIVRSISFPQSNYVSLLPFQIDIDCYESGFFSGVYGILEPKNQFTYTQNKDQSVSIEHTMSCRGFNTCSNNSNALQNAKNYLQSISGFSSQILPCFINLCSGILPSLVAQREGINRLLGTYEVTENYILDPFFQSGVLRYTAIYDSGIENGISTVKIGGNLRSSKNYPIDLIRNRFKTFDIFSSAVDAYSGATNGLLDLNPFYLSSGVSEDDFSKTINFDVLFNNDPAPNPYFDYSVNFNHDLLADITTANIQGSIKGRGDLNTRYQRVLAFASGINLYSIAAGEYISNGYQYNLNPYFITTSTNKNAYIGEVGLSASYTDKMLPISGFSSLDYNLSFVPSLEKFSAVPVLDGLGTYVVTDLGYTNRAILTIQGKGVINQGLTHSQGVSLLNNFINITALGYLSGKNRVVLEGQSINWGNAGIGNNVGFNAVWSFEDNILII